MAKTKASRAAKGKEAKQAEAPVEEGVPVVCWSIDLNWYVRNNRSFLSLALERVCAQCRKKMKGEPTEKSVLTAIRDCCAGKKDYIPADLPIMESVFRILLASGNEPLTVDEIGSHLADRRGPDAYRTSGVFLSRLLGSDMYYGFKQSEN